MSGSTEILYIGEALRPKTAVEIFLEAFLAWHPLEIDVGAHDKAGLDEVAATFQAGIYIYVRKILSPLGWAGTQERFGFEARVMLSFERDFDETIPYEKRRAEIEQFVIVGTLALLNKHAFDVALTVLYDNDTVLRRLDNRLILNNASGRWTKDRLQLVSVPYTLQDE